MRWIMLLLFRLGASVCVWNFDLSFPRYLVHRLRGGRRGGFRTASAVPVAGSLLVLLSVRWLWQPAWLLPLALILVAIDTGGFHWFIVSMLLHGVGRRTKPVADSSS